MRGKPGHRSESGEGRAKAIAWTIFLVLLVYLGWKLIPPYVADYQLQDKMLTEARYATVNRRTDDDLRNIIFQEAQDLNVPARREDIKIENTSRMVKINVDYVVPVDLIIYHTDLHFSPSTENKSIM